jgi:hypothetical protein
MHLYEATDTSTQSVDMNGRLLQQDKVFATEI